MVTAVLLTMLIFSPLVSADRITVEATTKWKPISKDKVQGVWGKTDLPDDESHDGITTFHKNGMIEFKTLRVYCKGTYKVYKQKRKIVATYTKNTFYGPAVDDNPSGIIEFGKCKVVYRLKTNNKIKAEIKTRDALVAGGVYTKKGTSTHKDGEYSSAGFDTDDDCNVTNRYKMMIKNHRLTLTGPLYYWSDSVSRDYSSKKRTWVISANCIYSYEYLISQGSNKYSDSCTYKKIIQVSKKWMNGKSDKKTGEINNINFTVRNGEIVKLGLFWDPYDGGW